MLSVTRLGLSPDPVLEGTYTLGTSDGVAALASVRFLDAACAVSLDDGADSGTITLEQIAIRN